MQRLSNAAFIVSLDDPGFQTLFLSCVLKAESQNIIITFHNLTHVFFSKLGLSFWRQQVYVQHQCCINPVLHTLGRIDQ